MALGDRRYKERIPGHVRAFIEDNGLEKPDEFAQGPESLPYVPQSLGQFVFGQQLQGHVIEAVLGKPTESTDLLPQNPEHQE